MIVYQNLTNENPITYNPHDPMKWNVWKLWKSMNIHNKIHKRSNLYVKKKTSLILTQILLKYENNNNEKL